MFVHIGQIQKRYGGQGIGNRKNDENRKLVWKLNNVLHKIDAMRRFRWCGDHDIDVEIDWLVSLAAECQNHGSIRQTQKRYCALGIAKTMKTGSFPENWTTFCIKSMLWGVFDLWRPRHRRRNWLIDAFGSKMPNSCKFTNANLKSMSWDALGATPITILMPIRVNWWNHSGSRIPFPNSTLVWTSRRDAAVRWLRHFGSQTVFD